MFVLEKILSLSLFSPLPFILILVYIGLKALMGHKIKYGFLLIFIGISTYFVSCDFFLNPILLKLEEKYEMISDYNLQDGEVYILLGGGIIPATLEGNIPNESANVRITKTVQYYNKYPKKIYISGGMPLQDKESESSVYKKEMVALGVPADDIIIEEGSKTTQENALFIKKMLEEEKITKAVLITSANHMPRGMNTFVKNIEGVTFYPAPCNFIASQEKQKIFAYIPKYENFKKFKTILWENVGILYYRIRY